LLHLSEGVEKKRKKTEKDLLFVEHRGKKGPRLSYHLEKTPKQRRKKKERAQVLVLNHAREAKRKGAKCLRGNPKEKRFSSLREKVGTIPEGVKPIVPW